MIVSVQGNSKAHAVAKSFHGDSVMDNLVAIGPSIEFLNPIFLDFLTGIGLIVEINSIVYEEGKEPRQRVDPYDQDEDEDEEDENEW